MESSATETLWERVYVEGTETARDGGDSPEGPWRFYERELEVDGVYFQAAMFSNEARITRDLYILGAKTERWIHIWGCDETN